MDWSGRVLILAPHPDDEVIGAGGQFASMRDVWVVHITDGAPRNMQDAAEHGFARREDYAAARRQESLAALSLAGIGAGRLLSLGFCDQETVFHLPELKRSLRTLYRELQPDIVLVPAYEGGHPDHDSVAFTAHAVFPALTEYALYHAGPAGIEIGTFLDRPATPIETVSLDRAAAAVKRRMLDSFVTQRQTLALFSNSSESFRRAPNYDFAAPPHAGKLYYEYFSWGVNGEQWRELARQTSEGVAA